MLEIINLCQHNHEKILLFSKYSEPLDFIETVLKGKAETCRIDGQMTEKKRNEQIKLFNENSKKVVFLLTTGAAGVGINLTVASRVILLDAGWNPAVDSKYNAAF